MNKTEFEKVCANLKKAAMQLSLTTGEERNSVLSEVAKSIKAHAQDIRRSNALDVQAAVERGTSEAMIDRLSLDGKRIDGAISSLYSIIQQSDPLGGGEVWRTPSGMTIRRQAVPLGVVAVIYESRPLVTLDAFALCIKSGNAVLLRGSGTAYNSNKAIVDAIKDGLANWERLRRGDGDSGEKPFPPSLSPFFPLTTVHLMPPESDHSDVDMILQARGLIDVAVPRGGAKLISRVVSTARVPTIETGSGICHLYADKAADVNMAARIAANAKMSRPGVCNAIECILVHRDRLCDFLPMLMKAFDNKVEIRADDECYGVLKSSVPECLLIRATQDDWSTEFLDLVCAVHAVGSVYEAVDFINLHGTGHSECIVTEDRAAARLFQERVDAAAVYVNASTRFTDGGEFGFGAELGISTQKLHARGPMGAKALTTTKYLIDGDGQVRR